MFFVINKEKIYAYVVSIITIVILFFMSTIMKENPFFDGVEETSTNIVEEKNIENKNLLNTSSNVELDNNVSAYLVPND